MGKIIGIDLGTTNSVVAIMEGKEPKVIVERGGGAPHPVRRRVGRQGRGARRPDRQAPGGHRTPRTPSTRRSASSAAGSTRSARRASASRTRSCAARTARADVDVRGKKLTPPEVSAHPAEAQEGRRGLPRREGDRSGHHRPGVLQRRAAPGHQGRRPHRRSRRQAHRQRADRGRARVRPRQEKNEMIAVYDFGGGTFDISILEVGDNVVRGRLDQRRHAPRRRRHRPPRHGLADRRVQEGHRHRRLARTRW